MGTIQTFFTAKEESLAPGSIDNDDDADVDMLQQVLRQSQEDYDKAESLRRKEEEDLQRAINESLRNQNSHS